MSYDQVDYRRILQTLLQTKCHEFASNGYHNITEEEFWEYLTNYKWKNCARYPRLYKMVADILNTSAVDYMNFVTIKTITKKTVNNWQFGIDPNDLKKLL